jgi:FeS assembly protein IscX
VGEPTYEGDRLYWDDSYALALRLMEAHPRVPMAEVTLGMLSEWVQALPDFADDPGMVNDELLHAILQEWLEESLAHD